MRLSRSTMTTPPAALVAAVALAACGGDGAAPASSPPSVAPSVESSAEAEGVVAFNDTDVRFTQSMLPHHMQAVRNSEILIAMGSDPVVIAIATKILDEQEQEIATMRGFLEEFGAQEKPAPAVQQAVRDHNTEELRNAATPEESDVIFLTNMVPHHSAAVPMSANEIVLGAFAPAIELAETIKATQRMEIMEMNTLIRARATA